MKLKVYSIEFALPRWLKRTLVVSALSALVLIVVGVAVRAAGVPTLTTFSPGEMLSSAAVNANFKALQDAVNAPVSIGAAQLGSGALPSGVTLTPSQIAAGSLPSGVLVASATNATNATNCMNAAPGGGIATGLARALQVQKIIGPQMTVNPGTAAVSEVACPAGYIAVGVACADNTQSPPMILNTAATSATVTESPQKGICMFYNNTTAAQKFTAVVTCLAFQATP
jgi:hypothetical protein